MNSPRSEFDKQVECASCRRLIWQSDAWEFRGAEAIRYLCQVDVDKIAVVELP